MDVEAIKKSIVGQWKSIATEVRPSAQKNADGSAKPFYLHRKFIYSVNDTFELEIINSADAYGIVPLVKLLLKGTVAWQGVHPIAEGAQKVDFTANQAYEVTPLIQGFADAMNQVANKGFNHWEINKTQSILGKAFVPFNLAEGQIFKEYDLMYVLDDILFWGARHTDGRGFDTDENRPTNLQIPMARQR